MFRINLGSQRGSAWIINAFQLSTTAHSSLDRIPAKMLSLVYSFLQACLFAMVSPDENNVSETISTLHFGSNARQVQLGEAKKNVRKGGPSW